MFTPARTLILVAAVGLSGIASNSANAQGNGSGWQGYAPGYTWGTYAAPNYTVVTPAPAPRPAVGWQGYQPAQAWQGYQPAQAWQGYQPGQAVRRAPAARSYSAPRAPAHHREFGTGRNVFHHKPWLPGQ
ncbi:hypothetical protein TA3x_004082 [Tundrisphaera sp. TA3]|uniref:hypothetical protein n=1 Tax=Tundrisphaera sp. TA3 TaxID=3435775 RepID=UPI003EBDA568